MPGPRPPQWECLRCATTTDLVSDDYCPGCGETLPTFAAYRPDGWPLCPRCGEDELYSRLVWLGDGDRPPLDAYVAAGMACYGCDWKTEGKE